MERRYGASLWSGIYASLTTRFLPAQSRPQSRCTPPLCDETRWWPRRSPQAPSSLAALVVPAPSSVECLKCPRQCTLVAYISTHTQTHTHTHRDIQKHRHTNGLCTYTDTHKYRTFPQEHIEHRHKNMHACSFKSIDTHFLAITRACSHTTVKG